jgi:protein-tyrosine-phosphatase
MNVNCAETLGACAVPEILLVCYGNICRSPMAEVLLEAALRRRLGSDHVFIVSSAGTGAMDGNTASRHGIAAMRRRGLDLSTHTTRALTPHLVRTADRIVCMTAEQADAVTAMYASAAGKTTTLGIDVPDPIGGTAEDYERVAELLEERIEALADEIAGVRR